jgi:hypothetical protein
MEQSIKSLVQKGVKIFYFAGVLVKTSFFSFEIYLQLHALLKIFETFYDICQQCFVGGQKEEYDDHYNNKKI